MPLFFSFPSGFFFRRLSSLLPQYLWAWGNNLLQTTCSFVTSLLFFFFLKTGAQASDDRRQQMGKKKKKRKGEVWGLRAQKCITRTPERDTEQSAPLPAGCWGLLSQAGCPAWPSRSGGKHHSQSTLSLALHPSGGRDGQSGESQEDASKQVLWFTGALDGQGKNGEVRGEAEPEAISTGGARGGTAGSCHPHMEVEAVQEGWRGAPTSWWLQESWLRAIPDLMEVLGEDQQPREVFRRQTSAGEGRELQSQQSPWWQRKEPVGIPHARPPAQGRVPAGPGGGRFGPSCVCWLAALPFLLQGQEDRDANPGPVQPGQKQPCAPLPSLARAAAGVQAAAEDHSRDRTNQSITSTLPWRDGWSSPVTALTPWPGVHSMLGLVFLPQHCTAHEAPAAPGALEDVYVGAIHPCL